MIGAQAIVVPCPPMSDAEPTKAFWQTKRDNAGGGDESSG